MKKSHFSHVYVMFSIIVALLLLSTPSFAQTAGGLSITSTTNANQGTVYSIPVQTLLAMTMLGFIPAILLMMTAFTRIIIVLSLLRMALGTQNTPPNQVLVGLTLFLTFFIMSPVLEKINQEAYQPYSENKITFNQALDKAEPTIKDFLIKQTRQDDLALYLKLAQIPPVENIQKIPLKVAIPAFITSELKTAFQIGFMIFLPFLVIDIVVSSVLMAMGMMMLSPMMISLPFKLMLFVLVDGWGLLTTSLVASFHT